MVEIVKLVRDQYGELHVDGKLRTWKRVAQLLREESVPSSGRLRLREKVAGLFSWMVGRPERINQ